MEKYSDFNDPFTGINPFVNQTTFQINPLTLIKSIFLFPIYFLLHIGINTISFFIKINTNSNKIKGRIACNASSIYDKYVIHHLLGNIPQFYLTKTGYKNKKGGITNVLPKDAVIFVEGCNSNNKGILKFVRNIKVDYVMGLKYSAGCIFMHGSFLRFLVCFIGNRHSCDVQVMLSDNLEDLIEVTNLPQLNLGMEDKERFTKFIEKIY